MSGISSIQAINNLTATFRTRLLKQTSQFERQDRLNPLVAGVGDEGQSGQTQAITTGTEPVTTTDGVSRLGQTSLNGQPVPAELTATGSRTALDADLLRAAISQTEASAQTLLDGGDVVSLRLLGQLSSRVSSNPSVETPTAQADELLAATNTDVDQSPARLREELVDQALVPQFFERTPFIPAGQNAAGFQPPLTVATPASVQAALASNIVSQQNGQTTSGLLAKYGLGQRSNGQRGIPVNERRRRTL